MNATGQAQISNCVTCDRPTMERRAYYRRSPEARTQLVAQNVRPRGASGKCRPCHLADLRHARPPEDAWGRRTVPRDELREEWQFFADPSLTVAENCRRIAPRIGMRWETMEKALYRTGILGRRGAA